MFTIRDDAYLLDRTYQGMYEEIKNTKCKMALMTNDKLWSIPFLAGMSERHLYKTSEDDFVVYNSSLKILYINLFPDIICWVSR